MIGDAQLVRAIVGCRAGLKAAYGNAVAALAWSLAELTLTAWLEWRWRGFDDVVARVSGAEVVQAIAIKSFPASPVVIRNTLNNALPLPPNDAGGEWV